jgi:hypothetical protein
MTSRGPIALRSIASAQLKALGGGWNPAEDPGPR